MNIRTLTKTTGLAVLVSTAAGFGVPADAQQVDGYLGEIRSFGFTYCPLGWALANGQLLLIDEYQALFSLYGNVYGGDGRITFALPDLRGRSSVRFGQGAGLPNYPIGDYGGAPSFTMSLLNIPIHSHTAATTVTVRAINAPANSTTPGNLELLANSRGENIYGTGTVDTTFSSDAMRATTAVTASGTTPVDHRGPYLAVTWCVVLDGTYPPRN